MKKIIGRSLFFFAGLALSVSIVFLGGCKADPAEEPTGFLGKKHPLYRYPTLECFQRIWYDKNFKGWDKFKKIYFAPVNVDYVINMNWWNHVSVEFDRKASIENLGKYMREAFIKAHKENKHPKYALKVVDKPDAETVVVEMAITEVVPTKVWLNAAGYFFLYSAIDQGVVAMEARIKDGATGKVFMKVMDREKGRITLVNVRDLTWYSHAHVIMDDWAAQSVEFVNSEENDIIEDSSPFTLLPW
jgi:hypothetical protein